MKVFKTEECLCHSTYTRDDCKLKLDVPWYRRCAPATGASTPALIALLLRWSNYDPAKGGLRDTDSRDAARELWTFLVKAATRNQFEEWSFQLEASGTFEPVWPRPQVYNTVVTAAVAVRKGLVDLTSFFELVARLLITDINSTGVLCKCLHESTPDR